MQSLKKHLYFTLLTIGLWACGPSDASEDTEFLQAVRQNKKEKINQLLTEDAQLLTQKTKVEGLTALHVAVERAKPETVELLLEKGAKVDETTNAGNTALHIAVRKNAFARTRILLEAGADPSIRNKNGQTAWDLIDKKTSKKWFNRNENEILALLLRYDYLPDTALGENQTTLLHRFSEKAENPDIIRLLIEKNQFDPMARDAYGWTPLHYAAKGGREEVAQVLLNQGADINARSTKNREEIRGDADAKIRYKYPVGATPRDVSSKRSSRSKGHLLRLYKKYGGKRSKDLE